MTASERISQFWASRQQTTADVERDWGAYYAQRAAEAEAGAEWDATYPRRTPLTTSQHILHLLLTVFTCGLWLPVWIIRASQGNRARG